MGWSGMKPAQYAQLSRSRSQPSTSLPESTTDEPPVSRKVSSPLGPRPAIVLSRTDDPETAPAIERRRCLLCWSQPTHTGTGFERLARVPRCACGGVLRPEVVLYEEPLDERDITDAVNFIRAADVLIVGGTSLAVYPAAGLLRYYTGNKLALVNMGATDYDESADLLIREKIGKVFSEV